MATLENKRNDRWQQLLQEVLKSPLKSAAFSITPWMFISLINKQMNDLTLFTFPSQDVLQTRAAINNYFIAYYFPDYLLTL